MERAQNLLESDVFDVNNPIQKHSKPVKTVVNPDKKKNSNLFNR